MKLRILYWNMYGINGGTKHIIIKSLIWYYLVDLACLQEMKVQHMLVLWHVAHIEAKRVGQMPKWSEERVSL